MSSTSGDIPMVDASEISLIHVDVGYKKYRDVGARLGEALRTWGFAYVSNHGIPASIVEGCAEAWGGFFELPVEEKKELR